MHADSLVLRSIQCRTIRQACARKEGRQPDSLHSAYLSQGVPVESAGREKGLICLDRFPTRCAQGQSPNSELM